MLENELGGNILEKLTIKKVFWGHESQLVLIIEQGCIECFCMSCIQADYTLQEAWNSV